MRKLWGKRTQKTIEPTVEVLPESSDPRVRVSATEGEWAAARSSLNYLVNLPTYLIPRDSETAVRGRRIVEIQNRIVTTLGSLSMLRRGVLSLDLSREETDIIMEAMEAFCRDSTLARRLLAGMRQAVADSELAFLIAEADFSTAV